MSTALVSRQVFQRYYEPTILVFLILAVGALFAKANSAKRLARQNWGLLLLSCFQIGISVVTVYL